MTEHNTTAIITRLWQALSHIRGVMPEAQMQQIAIAFVFLRRIDCLIGKYAAESALFYSKNRERLSDERLAEELCIISGAYPFYNYSGYTFSGILLANNSIEVVLNSYLQGFSVNVQEILEGMGFNQNLAIMQRQSRYLVEMFDLFSEMDLSSTSVDNEEFLDIILSLVSMNSRAIGTFATSSNISNLICECLLSTDLRSHKNEITTIYDPVCGTGGMLAIAGEKAKSFAIHQDNISLYGQEISVFPSALAKALVLLSGNENSKIIYGDTLTDDQFRDNHFQYILADMPYGLQWRPIKDRIEKESLDVKGRFSIGLPSVNDSQFLFIEHIISKMDAQGSRAAFLTTASVLWGGSASSGESRIRRWMFENDMVETIIALPSGVLSTTNIPVYLWILSNKKKDSQKGKVRLINASTLSNGNGRLFLNDDFFKAVVDEYKSNIISTASQIVKNDDFGFFEVALLEDGKKKETVTISLDTNIEEFIEKERQPFAKGKVTVDYASVEKGYSIYFEKFFKTEDEPIAPIKKASEDMLSYINAVSSIKQDIEDVCKREVETAITQTWSEIPLRSAVDVILGTNRPPVPSDDGLPLLSVAYLRKNTEDNELYAVSPKTRCSSVKDAIIILKGANAGEIFRGVNAILSPSLAAIRCINETIIAPQYLYYLIKGYEKSLMSLAKGAAIKSIDSNSILDFKCLIPPIEEQLKIALYLDSIVGKLDNVKLNDMDNVFAAYRQILIENVVRGKLNIS